MLRRQDLLHQSRPAQQRASLPDRRPARQSQLERQIERGAQARQVDFN